MQRQRAGSNTKGTHARVKKDTSRAILFIFIALVITIILQDGKQMNMENKDIRWHQRFSNYNKALFQLTKFIDKGDLNELEEQGLIKAFEYTYELAWNTMKDFYEEQGETAIQGSKDAIRMAFNRGLIKSGQAWMNMVQSRIKSSHTYNEETADEIADEIVNSYYKLFLHFQKTMEELRSGKQISLDKDFNA